MPPSHPNCRCTTILTQEAQDKYLMEARRQLHQRGYFADDMSDEEVSKTFGRVIVNELTYDEITALSLVVFAVQLQRIPNPNGLPDFSNQDSSQIG